MDAGIDRREFLRVGGLAGGALILGGVPVDAWARRHRRRPPIPLAREASFAEGVASGAPKPRGIVLWTRVGNQQGDRRLRLEVARDPTFRRTVLRRDVVARADADHTVKVRVEGRKLLAPHEEYFYRFVGAGSASPVGRFRTLLPPDSRQPVRIAFWSCQDWQAGFYGAHRVLAERDDLDLIVCLGDYVYERNFYYTGPRRDTLGANRDGEVQTLDEYRAKYRLYRSDPDLRAMHASHALYTLWDDHEAEDNYAGDQPGDETIDRRIPFAQRRANGYRSFAEYIPQDFMGRGTRLYRSLRVGRLAELFLLDQRQYRDDQPCGDTSAAPCPEAEDPSRTMLGPAQKEWFKRGLQASGARWKLVANPLMMMSIDTAPGTPFLKDSWDGYSGERREINEHIRARGISDVSYISGDIHTFFAGDVTPSGRGADAIATEFVTGSVTSWGIPETLSGEEGARDAVTPEQAQIVSREVRTVNPHIKYDEQDSRGFGIVEAREHELGVEFVAVPTMPVRSTAARTLARFVVARDLPRVQQA